MRLTLRTMLAYLDDILDPADAQDLGRKIEESEFASSLVGRIRDVSRRLRLGAPKLTGRGMGLDPNTVAEYLDNTLSVARVPDFEKVCLESDMHLAEVACSHQILALVLGSPADLGAVNRQRMYKLAARPEAETFKVADAPAPVQPLYRPRPKAEVPEYLREERSGFGGWLKIAAAILVLAGLALAVLKAVGPFDQPAQVAQGPQAPLPAQTPAVPTEDMAASSAAGAPGSETTDFLSAESAENGATAPSDASSSSAIGEIEEPGPIESDSIEGDGDHAQTGAVPVASADAGQTASRPNLTDPLNVGADLPPVGSSDDAIAEVAPAPGEEPAEAPAQNEPQGTYVSGSDVLLRWQGDAMGWSRVPQHQALGVNEQLLSLPSYRSKIALSSGVSLQLVGDTQVSLQPPAAPGTPTLEIGYGRVLITDGKPGAQISIAVGELRGTLTLVDATSVVGIRVRPLREPGSDPEAAPAAPGLDLYVSSGQVMWMVSTRGEPENLMGPQHWSWPVPVSPESAANLEPWVLLEAEDISPIERQAGDQVSQLFALGGPARGELRKLAEHRKIEVRSLAVRCLAAIGNYDALVQSLSDFQKRSAWKQHVEDLASAVAQSPESARRVHLTLERLRGAQSKQLYRMLWGYSDAQLRAGAAQELVQALSDEQNLDVRVVAYCTLAQIAGKGLGYQPGDNIKARQAPTQSWREWAHSYQTGSPQPSIPALP